MSHGVGYQIAIYTGLRFDCTRHIEQVQIRANRVSSYEVAAIQSTGIRSSGL